MTVLRLGDCIEIMATFEPCSVDAIVTDPPYGIGFMGKDWDSPGGIGDFPMRRTDATNTVNTGVTRQGGRQRSCDDFVKRQARDARTYQEWTEAWATEALRVLKPGGYALVFGGTRTFHRLACGLEDAGFEIRDVLCWLYGSGFPKSLDVSKAIDAAAGAEREVVGAGRWTAVRGVSRAATQGASNGGEQGGYNMRECPPETAPHTPEARTWQGWGTALKPAYEPVILARKPLAGTVAGNVLATGCGALNIDACRIQNGSSSEGGVGEAPLRSDSRLGESSATRRYDERGATDFAATPGPRGGDALGRWPANVVLDEQAAAMLDEQTGELPRGYASPNSPGLSGSIYGAGTPGSYPGGYPDTGGASRFFYVPKAASAERNAGLAVPSLFAQDAPERNGHPTVKPIALMRWLCRLVTAPSGIVLDPFLGSGSTGIAAGLEGFRFLGIEREAEYMRIAEARISHWLSREVIAA